MGRLSGREKNRTPRRTQVASGHRAYAPSTQSAHVLAGPTGSTHPRITYLLRHTTSGSMVLVSCQRHKALVEAYRASRHQLMQTIEYDVAIAPPSPCSNGMRAQPLSEAVAGSAHDYVSLGSTARPCRRQRKRFVVRAAFNHGSQRRVHMASCSCLVGGVRARWAVAMAGENSMLRSV